MTSPPAVRALPALERLLGIPVREFAEEHWGRQPLYCDAAALPGTFEDLFSLAAVDELVTVRGLRTPFLRVAKDGRTLGDKEFTSPGGVGATIADQISDDRLVELFAGGSTLVLQALHRTWAPLIRFGGQLSGDLGHPVQINAYVTPRQSTGFSSHYDVHDVFVVQISGEKQWQIRPPVLPSPLRTQPWEQRAEAVRHASTQAPMLDLTLRPGDCLYLPRGYLHAATALGQISTHLTIGVHAWTRTHLLRRLADHALTRLAGDERLRGSLPLGLDLGAGTGLDAEIELVRAALLEAITSASGQDLLAALAGEQRGSLRADPVAPLATVTAAGALALGDRLVVRRHLAARCLPTAEGIRVLSRAGTHDFPATQAAAVRALLDGANWQVDDLDLGQRLLLTGLGQLAPSADP